MVSSRSFVVVAIVLSSPLLAAGQAAPSLLYPSDYWQVATQLTEANFEKTVQEAVASTRTLFVRWHAGPACRSCLHQAPAWYEACRLFGSNPDVSFADVNVKEANITGPPYFPGQGGWPTIRYFNQETGVAGAPYIKKTDLNVADELGPSRTFMFDFVEEAGKTVLCGGDGRNCDQRSLKYLETVKVMDAAGLYGELDFLRGLDEKNMAQDPWVKRMQKIVLTVLSEQVFTENDQEM